MQIRKNRKTTNGFGQQSAESSFNLTQQFSTLIFFLCPPPQFPAWATAVESESEKQRDSRREATTDTTETSVQIYQIVRVVTITAREIYRTMTRARSKGTLASASYSLANSCKYTRKPTNARQTAQLTCSTEGAPSHIEQLHIKIAAYSRRKMQQLILSTQGLSVSVTFHPLWLRLAVASL